MGAREGKFPDEKGFKCYAQVNWITLKIFIERANHFFSIFQCVMEMMGIVSFFKILNVWSFSFSFWFLVETDEEKQSCIWFGYEAVWCSFASWFQGTIQNWIGKVQRCYWRSKKCLWCGIQFPQMFLRK